MRTIQLYLLDSYIKEAEGNIIESKGNTLILDRTIFYAASGGQPSDTGIILSDSQYGVIDVSKENGEIIHKLDRDYAGGTGIKMILDWEKRYNHMKLHTSIHIISAIAMNEFGARITGNQIYDEYARIDFNFQEWNTEISKNIEYRANEELKKGHEVSILQMKREEVLKSQNMIKVDPALLPDDEILRIVKIGDVDVQPDGGTHVKNTSEIGTVNIYKIENKGKNNKRMYFRLQ